MSSIEIHNQNETRLLLGRTENAVIKGTDALLQQPYR